MGKGGVAVGRGGNRYSDALEEIGGGEIMWRWRR